MLLAGLLRKDIIMEVIVCKDYRLIEAIIKNPILWQLMGHIEDPDKYEVPKDRTWLLASDEEDIIGLMELHPMTAITYIAHIHIRPKYHKTGKSLQVVEATKEYLKKTHIKNIITTVPLVCTHVIKLMNKTGFVVQGSIKDGIVYDNRIQDLLLFQLKV